MSELSIEQKLKRAEDELWFWRWVEGLSTSDDMPHPVWRHIHRKRDEFETQCSEIRSLLPPEKADE